MKPRRAAGHNAASSPGFDCRKCDRGHHHVTTVAGTREIHIVKRWHALEAAFPCSSRPTSSLSSVEQHSASSSTQHPLEFSLVARLQIAANQISRKLPSPIFFFFNKVNYLFITTAKSCLGFARLSPPISLNQTSHQLGDSGLIFSDGSISR